MDLRRDPETRLVTLRLFALYAVIGAGWLALGRSVMPSMLGSAYRGRGAIPALDRWVQGRFHRPLDHYLGLWADFSNSVLLALIVHLGLVLLALRQAWSPGGGSATDLHHRRFLKLIVGLSGVFLGFAVLSGPRQDYVAYLEIWEAVGRGQDPWRVSPEFGYSLNAYGPLFVILSPMAWWSDLAPKLLFAAAYLAMVILLARPAGHRSWRWLVLAMGPFFWVEIAYFGHFDILVALACVVAVSGRLRGDDWTASLGLAVGSLLKFIPLALLPFLALDGRRLRFRLIVVATTLMGVGMGLATLIWGSSALRPLGFAYGRSSEFASIFRFLRGPYSPVRGLGDVIDVDRFSVPCLLVFGLSTLLISWAFRLRADRSCVLAALVVATFYKVGFLQYQMIPVVLLISWISGNERTWVRRPLLRWAVSLDMAWITVLDLLVCWGGGVIHPGDPLGWLADVAGLPTFLLSVFLWLALARAGRQPST